MEVTSGHPRPSSVEAPVYRGCPAWTHGCSPESRMTLRQRANPSWCGCCCAGSRDVLSSLRSAFHVCLRDVITTGCISCATENTYTSARLEALSKLSVVTILSHSYHFHQKKCCCGFWVLFPTRHLVRDVPSPRSMRSHGIFLLVVGSVAIRLVHADVDLFLFSED